MEQASINGYTLKYKLGNGGMAEVWYAENNLQMPAAVKILHRRFCEESDIVFRFQNEAQLMTQLNHPHIRKIQGYGTIEGRPCMILEYLEGIDLSKRMKNGEKFTDSQLKEWWNNLTDALHYTHRKNIIHRDIKPANLFLTEQGIIKLLDFGVAKIKDNITITQTGSRMGTLMYMSPEQVYDVKNLNHKTDVYSLAVTFYHLVTGNPPYDSSKISDFEIQENIVRKSIDTSVLQKPWQDLLPEYFYKIADERKELQKIEEGREEYTGETIYMNPEVQPQPQVQPKHVQQQNYRYRQRTKSSSSFTALFPIAIIVGLIFLVLNKDRVLRFFKPEATPAKKEITKKTTTDKKKSSVSTDIEKTPDIAPDTITSEGSDGNVDQVIVNANPQQKESEIKNYINDYYKSRSSCDELSRFFTGVVKQYYNKSNVSLSTIQKECATYHERWKFVDADIDENSLVFNFQNDNVFVDFTMKYYIKQNDTDPWIPYKIDVSMVINNQNKIERIVERRIEKL